MSGRAVTALVLVLMGTGVVEAAAQTSLYGVRGLGHPGRLASTRARGLGGGLAALDPGSPVNPASIAGLGGMSVQLMSETDFRQYQVGAVSVDGLSVAAAMCSRVAIRRSWSMRTAISFSSYDTYI